MKTKLQTIIDGAIWGVESALFFPRTSLLDRVIGEKGKTNYISDLEYLTRGFVMFVIRGSALTAGGFGVYYLLK